MSDWLKPFSSGVSIVTARWRGGGHEQWARGRKWANQSRVKSECGIKSFILIKDDISSKINPNNNPVCVISVGSEIKCPLSFLLPSCSSYIISLVK